ncbi:hypothetical protein [Marinobacter sp. DUT-1]|uniref:hypothetical protein n=1 Tax=Marinobacter sp. DUT-1 TaxID=3412037 RepID=UPI003D16FF71
MKKLAFQSFGAHLSFFLFLLAAVYILWPGLYGAFYLDDYPNLESLPDGQVGLSSALSYLINVPVGGSGRPLSFITFLMQSSSWPESPFNFKLVNLIIHIANGTLVYALAILLSQIELDQNKEKKESVFFFCAVASFFWLVLPINMSTVFYVVQRMVLLSTLMCLVALVGYCYLRVNRVAWGKREYILATGFIAFGYIGIFAKETAILVGLLVLVLEFSIFSRCRPQLNKAWKSVVLIFPFLTVVIYLLMIGKLFGGYGYREFSLGERLLAEIIILFDYVAKILFPTNARINLYNDGFPYRALIESWIVVGISLIGLVSIVVVGFMTRYRLLSFAILFFLTGHLLESTVLALELYFEHRNYLPSVGIVIAVALGAGQFFTRRNYDRNRLRVFVQGSLIIWGCWITLVGATEATTWGDPKKFAVAAVTERPGSIRARQEFAAHLANEGDYMSAANVLYSVNQDFGKYAGTYAQLILLQCLDDRIPLPEKKEFLKVFSESRYDRGVLPALKEVWRVMRSGSDGCGYLSREDLISYVDMLWRNSAYKGRKNFSILKSLIFADQGSWPEAIKAIENIPDRIRSISEIVLLARYHAADGQYDAALTLLDGAQRKISGELEFLAYSNEIERLRGLFLVSSGRLEEGVKD